MDGTSSVTTKKREDERALSQTMRKWVPAYAAALIFLAAAGSMAPAASAARPATLHEQVSQWIEALSAESGYELWKSAAYSISPLGPGTHSWYVTVKNGPAIAGYLIVEATDREAEPYRLVEYGSGPHPLFDSAVLRHGMSKEGIGRYQAVPLYYHPLLAVWHITKPDGAVLYADAMSGETLPVDDKLLGEAVSEAGEPNGVSAAASIGTASIETVKDAAAKPLPAWEVSVRRNASFERYGRMPWLTGSPLAASERHLLPAMLDKRAEIRYTAELYRNTTRFVWAVVGYDQWSDGTTEHTYITLEGEGTRNVLFDLLLSEGEFYR